MTNSASPISCWIFIDLQAAQKRVEQNMSALVATQTKEEQDRRAIVLREARRSPKHLVK